MSVTVSRTCAMELVLIAMNSCCQSRRRDDFPAPPRSVHASHVSTSAGSIIVSAISTDTVSPTSSAQTVHRGSARSASSSASSSLPFWPSMWRQASRCAAGQGGHAGPRVPAGPGAGHGNRAGRLCCRLRDPAYRRAWRARHHGLSGWSGHGQHARRGPAVHPHAVRGVSGRADVGRPRDAAPAIAGGRWDPPGLNPRAAVSESPTCESG